jgi:hypothetical protein
METLTFNGNMNINGNNSRPHPTKPRSNNFSHAAVNKTDVGDFQAGYFVMADMPYQPQQQKQKNHNINRTLERHSSEKRNPRPPQQPHRARSTNDLDTREGDNTVSHGRLTPSPNRSPTRTNKRNSHSPPQPPHPQSTHTDSNNLPMSPHKPRKAPHEKHAERDRESVSPQHESGSPPRDKGPSPTPNRWAGPAFSNAPPPSSLPLPDFPPFAPSESSSPPSSPPQSASTSLFLVPPPVTYREPNFFIQPPLYSAPYPHFNAHYSFAEATPAHRGASLDQLSTDLRRMLNITSEPVYA